MTFIKYKIDGLIPSLEEYDIVETLYKLIKDSDALVIANAVQALNEILFDEGGIAISQKMIIYLLNKIKVQVGRISFANYKLKEFNEWGQCLILDLTAKYVPKSDQEMLDIMVL